MAVRKRKIAKHRSNIPKYAGTKTIAKHDREQVKNKRMAHAVRQPIKAIRGLNEQAHRMDFQKPNKKSEQTYNREG